MLCWLITGVSEHIWYVIKHIECYCSEAVLQRLRSPSCHCVSNISCPVSFLNLWHATHVKRLPCHPRITWIKTWVRRGPVLGSVLDRSTAGSDRFQDLLDWHQFVCHVLQRMRVQCTKWSVRARATSLRDISHWNLMTSALCLYHETDSEQMTNGWRGQP